MVFLLSTVKFVFGGVPLALGFNFPFFESVTVTAIGGFTGAVCFIFMSDKIISYYKKRKALAYIANNNKHAKKIFTRRKRFIITIKNKFGLTGIAFLTPLILSIPLGCFIAVRYYRIKQRILIFMFTSILMWAIAGYYLYKPLINAIRTHLL
jgi:hypothetical protein